MYKSGEVKEKLLGLGMITEADAMQQLYGMKGSNRQSQLQKKAVHVAIPSGGETGRSYCNLYFKSDIYELQELVIKEVKTETLSQNDSARLARVELQLNQLLKSLGEPHR